MKRIISFISAIGLLAITHTAISDSITDTYNTGDTLTATKLNNIKSAVNDNDSNISANSSGISSNSSSITNLETRVDALEAATGPVLKKLVWVNNLGEVIGDGSTSNKVIFVDQGIAWYFDVDTNTPPYFIPTSNVIYDQPNCSGNTYYDATSGIAVNSPFGPSGQMAEVRSGAVGNDRRIYVYDLDSFAPVTIVFPSGSVSGWNTNTNSLNCVNISNLTTDVVPAIPLTGVPAIDTPVTRELR